jgi:hypothetical protein
MKVIVRCRKNKAQKMNRLLTDNVWQQFRQANRGNRGHKLAALAYVSTVGLLAFRKGDLLICDASDQAIRSGETSANVLARFHRAGTEIYSCPDLHAKVVVLGRNVLIGSCNLSRSAAEDLRELAIIVSDSSIRSQAIAFIHELIENSSLVDLSFLKRIAGIPVTKPPRRGHGKRAFIQLGKRTWVIRTYQLDPERYKAELPLVKEAERDLKNKWPKFRTDIEWIRWTGKNKFRSVAREGDTIIVMNSLRGEKRIIVSAPAAILKRQDHGKWTRFYYETPDEVMSWSKFAREVRRLGIRHIKRSSTKELTPRDAALIDVIWGR